MRGDPAGMPAHDFNHHDAFVGFCGCVQPVDRFRDDLHGRIEAERVVGSRKIIVDGLGHANDGITFLCKQFVLDAKRIFASDGDQVVQSIPLPIGFKFLQIFELF